MEYKTILLHVDSSSAAEARIRLAIGLARAAGAHLGADTEFGKNRALSPGTMNEPRIITTNDDLRAYACAFWKADDLTFRYLRLQLHSRAW